jgi:hypothetical protein
VEGRHFAAAPLRRQVEGLDHLAGLAFAGMKRCGGQALLAIGVPQAVIL